MLILKPKANDKMSAISNYAATEIDLQEKLMCFLGEYYHDDPLEIVCEKKWRLNGHTKRIDVALSNNETLLAVFEIKVSSGPNAARRATEQLISLFGDGVVPLCYAVTNSEASSAGFEFIDVTRQVAEKSVASLDKAPRNPEPYDFEKTVSLFNLRVWESASLGTRKSKRQISICVAGGFFVAVGIAFLILDWLEVLRLSYERLLLMLAIVVIAYFSLLSPKINEINLGGIVWKLANSEDESE